MSILPSVRSSYPGLVVELWNSLDSTAISTFRKQSSIDEFAFSADSEIIFTTTWVEQITNDISTYFGEISLWDWKTGRTLTSIPGIAKVVPGPADDEFYYLTEEGHVTLARLPIWLRQPSITNGQITFEWLGREGTFQLQRKGSINEDWENVGVPVLERETTVPTEGANGFYRLIEIETTGTNP